MVQENKIKKIPLIVIGGPTASGKSSLSIRLAQQINGEIINADAFQIYKGMDIGTAKITNKEMQGIRHHMIDIISPNESFSVSEFVDGAKNAIQRIHTSGKVPIIVGGTGLFLNALLYDFEFGQAPKNDEIRKKYMQILETRGKEHLHSLLMDINPERASSIHANDTKKVIRALEVLEQGGSFEQVRQNSNYEFLFICLSTDREILYKKINERVDDMIRSGLEDEVQNLLKNGVSFDCQAMQAIGYREWKYIFDGTATREEVIELIKKNSRNYAKRQLTWFRHCQDIVWFDSQCQEQAIKYIKGKGYING